MSPSGVWGAGAPSVFGVLYNNKRIFNSRGSGVHSRTPCRGRGLWDPVQMKSGVSKGGKITRQGVEDTIHKARGGGQIMHGKGKYRMRKSGNSLCLKEG